MTIYLFHWCNGHYAVRYAATASPHWVWRNALSVMVEATQNLGSPTDAHLHAPRMLVAYWP
jgi:hypothetical protein